MRLFCGDCTEKHTAVAYYLLLESVMGYPAHKKLAEDLIGTVRNVEVTIRRLRKMLNNEQGRRFKIIGALSEAADECALELPDLAEHIRMKRLEFSITGKIDLDDLMNEIESSI